MVGDERGAGVGRVEVKACAKIQSQRRSILGTIFITNYSMHLSTAGFLQPGASIRKHLQSNRVCVELQLRYESTRFQQSGVFNVGVKLQPFRVCVISVCMWGCQSASGGRGC